MGEYTKITSEKRTFRLGFGELWRYRDLIVLLTKKTFVLSYKQTVLGPLWLLITPLLSSGIYSIVFGDIVKVQTDGIPQLLFFLCNQSLWTLFSSCLLRNANVFRENADLFGKVYFPRLAVPISNVLVQLAIFGVHFLLLLGFLLYYSVQGMICPNWTAWAFLPLVVLQVSLLGMCIGVLVSSMTTKYRDFSVLVSFGVRLWMYVSPVVYPLSQLDPGVLRVLVMLNPITAPMELFRWILLGEGTIDPLYTVGGAVLLCPIALGALYMFHRVERTFMDSV